MNVPRNEEIHNNLLNYLFIIPVLFSTFFSFLYLDTKSFWIDEAYSMTFVNLSYSQLWEIISRWELNMSLYYFLLKIWVEAFGDSEFMVRSLSVIFAAGGLIMTYAIGVRLFNIRTGLTAAFILAVNAFFIQYAQEARSYMLLLLLTTCSMYLFIQVIRRQQYKYYIALGLVNALVLYAHFFGFFMLIAQVTSLVFLPPGTIRWKKMLICAILTASLASPLAVLIPAQEHPAAWIGWIKKTTLVSVAYSFMVFTGRGGKFLLILYFVPCFLSLTIAVRILIRFKKSQILWQHALLFCWLFVPILSLYLVSMFKPFFVHRYLFFILPALVLLTGAGLSSLKRKVLYMTATSLLIILSLHNVFYGYYPEKKDDWRTAAHFITQNAREGDAILFYSWVAKIPFEYYYRKMNGQTDRMVSVYPFPFWTPIRIQFSTEVPNPSETMLESIAETYNRLWVVAAHDKIKAFGWDSRPIIHTIESKFTNRENISFKGINIKLYERRPILDKL